MSRLESCLPAPAKHVIACEDGSGAAGDRLQAAPSADLPPVPVALRL